MEFVDVATFLNEDDDFEYQLPKHQRCACHLLNLVSRVDALKATSSEAYKKVSRSTFGMDYIKDHLEEPLLQLGDGTSSSDEDDFSALKTSQAQESSKQLDGYLACSADHMEFLKSFLAVCKLSLRLNTPLPESAACERLFSIAGLVFSPRKTRLDSRNFENQILLKMNHKFLNLK